MLKRSMWMQALLVFALASAVKLTYVNERVSLPDADHPVLDSLFHDQWARGLAFDQWTADLARMQSEPYFRAPLYPYFLSLLYRTVGTSPRAVFMTQALLGAFTVSLMFCFCATAFGRRTAWVAAILQIGYWPFTYHEAERLIPTVSILLDMALLIILLRASKTRRLRDAGLAGFTAGLAAIARPTILIALPFSLAWLGMRLKPKPWRHLALASAMTLVVISPVTLRNYFRGHDMVFIASQGGVNFYIGNNPRSDGVRAVVPGTRADWWGGYDDARRLAQEDMGRSLRPSQVSNYWFRRGVDFIVQQPVVAARLYARKTALLLGNAEPSNERQLYFRRNGSRVISSMPVGFALILASSLVGIYFAVLRHRQPAATLCAIVATAYALGVIAFFVNSRFRLPVALCLIPLSACGFCALYDLARSRQWRTFVPVGGIACIIFASSMANPFGIGAVADSRGYYELGVDYYRKGEYARAVETLDRSLEADSLYAPAWMMRGRACGHLGDDDAAVRDLRRACVLDSTSPDALFSLGVAYQKAGRHAEAERPYLSCLAIDPTRADAATNLADVYFREQRAQDALLWLRRALAVDSTYANAIYGLGYYHEIHGDFAAAEAAYRRALPFQPARMRLERMARMNTQKQK